MALTATAQSALPSGPSWDETIVPALRKRLETESRMLSKRMSAASLNSMEENASSTFSAPSDTTARDRTTSPTYSLQSQKSVGSRRRPAHQQAWTTADNRSNAASTSRVNASNGLPPSKPPSFTRQRTKSQPFSLDSPRLPNGNVNGHAQHADLPTPESSRSTSPMYQGRSSDVKPTRIPMVARGRTPSVSSHGHTQIPVNSGRSDSHNGGSYDPYNPPTPEASPDLWVVEETDPSNHSRSTVSGLVHQRSGLLNEPMPFNTGSVTSSVTSQRSREQYDMLNAPPRPSADSEERPFEHWYRGEVSRNGGVGELRVGKRMEMLDIANYGHSLRKAPASRLPSTSGDIPVVPESRRRRRADSVVGMGARESFYMDEERAKEIEMVMDESPLTDLDGEVDTDPENTIHAYYTSAPLPPMPPSAADDYRSATPTSYRAPSRQQSAPPTRIPAPVPRQSSEPPRLPTPTPIDRGASEPPLTSARSRTPSNPQGMSRSVSTPQKSQSSSQLETPKRRAKSPASASSASASKRSRTKPKTTASRRGLENDKNRRSVAEYPAPPTDGGDMMDAIPSWTQPVPAGNWDEVVLPVVARKKGLDEHYEQADGSPRPRRPQDERVEPAPGTFGFDHSKYRPPRGEEIPMDEFGQHRADARARMAEEDERNRHVPKSPPSPAPFARYHDPHVNSGPPQTVSTDLEQGHQEEQEEDGGCCKCVIM